VQSADSDPPGVLTSDRREEYCKLLKRIVSRICSQYGRRNPALLAPIAAEMRRRVEELILTFLDIELEMMNQERVEGLEERLEMQLPEVDTVLVGTIDRINRNPNGYTLIDYKKKQIPTRRDLFSPQAVSIQMPFYIHLMESNNRPVTRAAYYSFENKRYHFIFGGPKTNMATAEDIRQSIEEVKGRLLDMRRQIAAGDYQIGSSPATNCARCRLREICRSSFSVNG
jgi:RecB family exonuclease